MLARISGNSYVFPGVASALGAFVVAGLSTAWTPSELGLLVAAGFVGSAVVGAALPGARGLGY